jgi:putative transcriptional regulator
MAFERIAEGLNEALLVARGERRPAKLHVPAEIDVRAIRAKLRMSQEDFAALYGFTINQIKDWEQGRARPIGGVRAYLMLIKQDPKAIHNLLSPAA